MKNQTSNNPVDSLKNNKCSDSSIEFCVKIAADATLPTIFGEFRVVAFVNNIDNKDHVALIKGDVKDKENVYLRIHSECLTGDVFGSKRCDCREQLIAALKFISQKEYGALIYLRQEGRGIGLSNKIKAYVLQEQGYDTSDANLLLGFKEDMRDYHLAAKMIELLNIKSVRLLTNNPKKIEDLKRYGIVVKERIPIEIDPSEYNKSYLKTKKEKFGHLFRHIDG